MGDVDGIAGSDNGGRAIEVGRVGQIGGSGDGGYGGNSDDIDGKNGEVEGREEY